MNTTIINNWNKVVGKDDVVFHLGDFGFTSKTEMKRILDQLNGRIYLIIGNHDESNINFFRSCGRFDDIAYKMHIYIDDKSIYLNHDPELCFAGAWKGIDATWQLFGHVHSSDRTKEGLDVKRLTNLFPTQYDVGVDNNNFTPISFEDVKRIIEDQQYSLNLIK